MGGGGYWYEWEDATFGYSVSVSPPPADEAVALIHKGDPEGPVVDQKPLVKVGASSLKLPLSSLKAQDSPFFVEFRFKKKDRKKSVVHALSLAQPAPSAIDAPPDAGPNDKLRLEVTEWSAFAQDRPGRETPIPEGDLARIASVRSRVKWKVDGKDLAAQGEKVDYTVDATYPKTLEVEAYLDKPRGKAVARIEVDDNWDNEAKRIEQAFRAAIQRMIREGKRTDGFWLVNNIRSFYTRGPNGEEKILRCYGQAIEVLKELDGLKLAGQYDPQAERYLEQYQPGKFIGRWKFCIASKPGHYWVEAYPDPKKHFKGRLGLKLDPLFEKFEPVEARDTPPSE